MAATAYGAYTYGSKINFCRGTRWIISNTMSELWPDEPTPKIIKRGTSIEIIGRENVDCGDLDQRLSLVQGSLVEYRANGDDRFVAENDVYTQAQYDAYRRKQKIAHEAEMHRHAMEATIAVNRLALVPIPNAIKLAGYEGGLQKAMDAGQMPIIACDVPKAQRYVDAARTAFLSGSYESARANAYSATAYIGNCHKQDMYARTDGDADLLFAKSELRLGMLTAGKNDADMAAGDYISCNEDHGYSSDDVAWCVSHRQEAHDIARE